APPPAPLIAPPPPPSQRISAPPPSPERISAPPSPPKVAPPPPPSREGPPTQALASLKRAKAEAPPPEALDLTLAGLMEEAEAEEALPPIEIPQARASSSALRDALSDLDEDIDEDEEADEEAQEEARAEVKAAAPSAALGAALGAAPAPSSVGELEGAVEAQGHLDRKTTVRYYKRMTQFKNHPVLVVFSREQIGRVRGVTQVEGGGVRVRADHSVVTVIPVFPGCLTAPNRVEVDIKPETVEVRLWLTPITLGNVKEARVEIWQDGRFLDQIPTPCRLTRHLWTKISGGLSLLGPLSRHVLPHWGIDLNAEVRAYAHAHMPQLKALLARVDPDLLWASIFSLVTLIVFLSLRAKMADPVQKKFTLNPGA
ncbi:hypothetical protein KKB55_21710, partial [Myxococcota bacterium]|nr:hypothetical protein [Myxococcota bacterium]